MMHLVTTISAINMINKFYDANLIFESGNKAIKSVGFKYSAQLYEMNSLLNTAILQKEIITNSYKPKRGHKFIVKERDRRRLVTANTMKDKHFNHHLCDNIINPIIYKYLQYDNSASQPNKGTHFHRKRFEQHIHQFYRQYHTNEGYILILDIKKYFDSISQNKVIEILSRFIKDKQILDNIYRIIQLEKQGINVGNQLSQSIGILYSYQIDNYIKIVKQCKYYGRYMDDTYIIHKDKDFLIDILHEIRIILNSIGLDINTKKTHIYKLSQKFRLLQIQYQLTESGHLIRKIHPKIISRHRRKLKKYYNLYINNVLTKDEIYNIANSWILQFKQYMSRRQIKEMSDLYEQLFNKGGN